MNFIKKLSSKLLLSVIVLALLTAWTVTSSHAAPNRQDGPVYIVQQGDTLGSIALRFGLSPDELAAANNIADPNALFIGQRLVIPGLEGIKGVLTSQTLPFGASLASLVRQYNLDQKDLVFLNRLASPSELIAGLKFVIPINEEEAPLTPLVSLQPGSTLLEIAMLSGTSPWLLVEENHTNGTWDILPGETLYAASSEENFGDSLFPAPITEIKVNNLPVIQGETLHITVSANTPIDLQGKFDQRDLTFFTEDDQNYHTFHGIHALAEPGPISLEISVNGADGSAFTVEQLIMLAEGGYGQQTLANVSEEYLDETAIAEEDAFLKPVLEVVSPEKHWNGPFQYPVDEPCSYNDFGLRRDYNNGGLLFYHTGLDFKVCAQNLNVYAPAAGKVVLAEELLIKGNYVLIDHGLGVFSGYAHLAEMNVAIGDLVETRDLIGLIGNTGRSLGPHLHFEILITGTPVNPQTWLTREFPQSVGD